jgi:hypothetical protein
MLRQASCFPAALFDENHFVQVGIDVVRHLIEATPLLAEFGRLVGRLQEIVALPLDVVDDALAIEAAMHADGDEARLARAMKRARSVITANAASALPGSRR